MINDGGWLKSSIWEHSASLKELYARRCQWRQRRSRGVIVAHDRNQARAEPENSRAENGRGASNWV